MTGSADVKADSRVPLPVKDAHDRGSSSRVGVPASALPPIYFQRLRAWGFTDRQAAHLVRLGMGFIAFPQRVTV